MAVSKSSAAKLVYGFSILGVLVSAITTVCLVASFDTDIRGVETNVVYTIQHLMRTGEHYTDPVTAPYAITQYSPLYYLVCAAAKGLGLRPGVDVYQIYVVCRSLSVTAALLAAMIIYLICVRQLNIRPGIWFVIVATFWVIALPWFCLVRPDAFVTLFTLVAVYFFLSYQLHKWVGALMWCAAFVVLALASKQSAVIVPFVMMTFLLVVRDFRGCIYLGVSGVAAFLLFCLLYAPFGNRFILDNVVGGVDNGVRFWKAFVNVYEPYLSRFMVIPAVAISIIATGYQERIKENRTLFLLSYLFVTLTVCSALLALKIGSAINYMIDSLTVGILLIGYYVQQTNVKLLEGRVLTSAVAVAAALLLSQLVLGIFIAMRCIVPMAWFSTLTQRTIPPTIIFITKGT